jgi:hypothetical protein
VGSTALLPDKDFKMKIKLLLALVVGMLVSGCTKTTMTSATTPDGKQWPFCVQVDNVIGVDVLGCASTASGAEQQKADFLKLHPGATVKVVKQVPIQEPKS